MANITAQLVKELRELTGSGMMDCKKALMAVEGDIDKAADWLRENGILKAQKKASRIAAEGLVRTEFNEDHTEAAIVEVNSETDFVAKNEEFIGFVEKMAKQALTKVAETMDDFLALDLDGDGKTVKEELTEKVAKIGENLNVRRFDKMKEDGVKYVGYTHGGGRIGVIVGSEGEKNDATVEALNNVAMQVAAMNPQYISRDEISADELAHMRDITVDAALNDPFSLPKPVLQKLLDTVVNEKIWSDADIAQYEEHKSNMNYLPNFLSEAAKGQLAGLANEEKEAIVGDKIFNGLVEGRFAKQLKDICLLDQVYVKAEDGKQSVAAYLKTVNPELAIKKVVRFETGEGIEKKQENFAEEVAKQMQ